jgi:hypothetical protein
MAAHQLEFGDKTMPSILDTFRDLLEAFDIIADTYSWQVAREELYQWAKDVEAALEVAGKDDELTIWRNATRDIQNSPIGTIHTAAERKKALFLRHWVRSMGMAQ